MNCDEGIYAEVVYDGRKTHTPARMGEARQDQLTGTHLENLVELAGRVCYDSLGVGRDSVSYHAHIHEVQHGSVWEHANITLRVANAGENVIDTALAFINRPGVWVRYGKDGELRVTMNLRAVVEFSQHNPEPGTCSPFLNFDRLRAAIMDVVCPWAPRVVYAAKEYSRWGVTVVDPEHPEEKWISLLLGGSRGMSHEQVRHKWRTAVSQRSTRYVDENESPWVEHPLVTRFLRPPIDDENKKHPVMVLAGDAKHAAKLTYLRVYETLEKSLIESGVDKFTARKQARGAARGYLGNALHTEMVFSASVAQWRRMIVTGTSARCSNAADAEIRLLYACIVRALQTTVYAEDFADIELVPAADGLGQVAQLRAPQ